MRAWHAGASHWAGITDINSASVGIEIQNGGHDAGLPSFPARQMRSVETLSLDIVRRHGIPPERVLAHSDVAPARKIDPGERFNWRVLAYRGVGHWVQPVELAATDTGLPPGAKGPQVRDMQEMLRAYGYGIEPTGEHDALSVLVVTAFQRHFRQQRADGRIDRSSLATLERLIAALPSRANA
jgi:N-acetylmuramoyl-L-alanine amidase